MIKQLVGTHICKQALKVIA